MAFAPQGLFGSGAPQSTPQMPKQPKKWQDIAMLIGGGIKDASGGQGNLQAAHGSIEARKAQFQQQLQAQQQQQQQQKLLQQVTQGMTPQMAAMYGLNPSAAAAAQAKQRFGHNTVAGGSSVVTYDAQGNPRLTQANQNFQNGSRVGTVGPNGNSTYDMGQNQSEAITSQNNLATQKLRGDELDVTRQNNLANQELTGFSNQTGRMNAVTNREKAQYAQANPTSDLGKSPLYMQDADGNVSIGQLGNGQIVQAKTPEGMSILSPYERAQQGQMGRSQGKIQGETQANLPTVTTNADRALKTVDQLLNHKGIDSGTGFSAKIPAIPGSDKYAFNIANKQAQGQVFLQAYEALKGGGVITEIEGLKGEQALARMEQAQSREDYEAGLKDYREVIASGTIAAYRKAGQEPPKKYQDLVGSATPQGNFSDMSDEDLLKIINGG